MLTETAVLAELPQAIRDELNCPYAISTELRARFAEDGYVVLRGVFSTETIAYFRQLVYQRVHEFSLKTKPLTERDEYGKAFLQVSNIWKKCPLLRSFDFSPRLASLTAGLMNADGVRLWDTHALYKEAGGGPTFMHTDWHYIPVDEDLVCAAWVPLQDTPNAMGSLAFVKGSHRFPETRRHSVSSESDKALRAFASEKELPIEHYDYAAGDLTVHNVRTLHFTGPNVSGRPRSVLSNFVIADGCRAASKPYGPHQSQYWETILGSDNSPGNALGGPDHPIMGRTPGFKLADGN